MDSPGNLDIIIVGAGICALARARQKLPKATVAVFEKEESVGGTWTKNTYPGLSCDIPSQLYSYSFAPNPEWSTIYATQPEILAYIKRVASQFECSSHIHLKQVCTGAEWLDDEFLWRVHFVDKPSDRSYIRHSRFLITAAGFCDEPNGAEDIQGVQEFGGHVFHSARWDHPFDFRDKDVVVVGNGCSANQPGCLRRIWGDDVTTAAAQLQKPIFSPPGQNFISVEIVGNVKPIGITPLGLLVD
ncbi:hypothetical protein B0T18DRAFT_490189 [Schizothecium vesticola]|uniref:FAD/NAD(P)-binding domain-containing protein n=1 Tax=Schizothecium vesticola TaxID=314040 RepID=A0AA40EQ81_9PEZI|nr:hypothetical protein B0T18DRAFT_490189 [Schizothecium vesticola]